MQEYKNTGSSLALSYFRVLLAQSYCFAGRYSQALDLIDASLLDIEAHNEYFFKPELYRVKAEIILASDHAENLAEENLDIALNLAREQKSKSLELKASTDLGRLWQNQGKYAQAVALLENILNQFTEGFKCKDWLRAEMLLNALKLEHPEAAHSESA